MKTHDFQLQSRILVVSLLAIAAFQTRADLTGQISAKQVFFERGKPIVADGTATIENEKGVKVASDKLVITGRTLEVAGKQGATFAYSPLLEIASLTNWPTQTQTNVAMVAFDGKDKWTLKDDQFFFMLECGANFQMKILVDSSLLLSSRISFPEGTYSLWGYSITVGSGGGAVVFKQGRSVDGENAIVVTPEKTKLDFSHKNK